MTVIVGRTEIHLGWPTAISIMTTLIVTTWMAAMWFNSFMNSQREMQRTLTNIARRDTLREQQMGLMNKKIDSVIKVIPQMVDSRRLTYYTERKINGKTVLSPVNN